MGTQPSPHELLSARFRLTVCAVALACAASSPCSFGQDSRPATESRPSALGETRDVLRNEEKKREEIEQRLESLAVEALELAKKAASERTSSSRAAEALDALIKFREAEIVMRRARRRVRAALDGAVLVAADGERLGTVTTDFESESFVNSLGAFGSEFSGRSIWNQFGKYGSTFGRYSPFNEFGDPPCIVIDGTVVAKLTVSAIGTPVAVAPKSLGMIFGRKVED